MEPQYHLRLSKVTGLLIIAQNSTKVYTGTKDQLEVVYKNTLMHNLLLGWWSIFSIVWNPLALYRNHQALQKLRTL